MTPAAAQLLGQPIEIPGQIGRGIERTIPDDLDPGDAVEDVAETIDEELDEQAESVEDTVEAAVEGAEEIAAAALDLFVGDVDAQGQGIEREVWVVLVPAEHAERIPGWALPIRERRDLDGLDLVLLRVDAPEGRGMLETEAELNRDAPGTVVDFNHVYGAGADEPDSEAAPSAVHADPGGLPGATAATTVAGRARLEPTSPATPVGGTGLGVGVIDSAVAADHEALRHIEIAQRDFVLFEGERPTSHGTAVASILVESTGAHALRIYVASVFFVGEDGESIATTGSLVAALEWLGTQGIDVINMSLTGPPNRVLEAALAAIAKSEVLVVAAVGNEGPTSAPLYPAGYDTVVGITAVDAANRIYRHANRGPQVAFAAPGVRARVARSNGGYGRETGTSMAAPFAAGVIARALEGQTAPPSDVLVRLEQNAIDLGAEGFDEVYGFGLIVPLH